MQLIGVRAKICYYDNFTDFAKEFNLGKEDIIFTEKVIYEGYIKAMELPCPILVRDNYEVGEPTEEAVDKMLLDIEKIPHKRIVAVGGGSVLDTAKALCIDGAYPFAHLLDKKEPNTFNCELITIPTTCGTGAEISGGGIYFMKSNGLKTAIVGPGADYAVLIPQFIEKLPFKIFFLSSMDALSHAIEGQLYSEDVVNEFGLAMARQAITTILDCQADLCIKGADYRQNRLRDFLASSTMANIALTANGANMVHALAYPPAEKFHLSHGESVYQFLIPVLNLYQKVCPDHPRFAALREMVKPALAKAGFKTDDEVVFTELEKMLNTVFPLRTMGEVGMTEDDIEPFSRNIVETKQRLLTKALIPVNQEQVAEMYRARL